jgi:hypothetical protein
MTTEFLCYRWYASYVAGRQNSLSLLADTAKGDRCPPPLTSRYYSGFMLVVGIGTVEVLSTVCLDRSIGGVELYFGSRCAQVPT